MAHSSRLALLPLLCAAHVGLAVGPNLLRNPGFEDGQTDWEPLGKGVVVDRQVVAGGTASLRCENAEKTDVSGAVQRVEVNQTKPVPLVVRGVSRSENVTGISGPHYSVWCDVEYTTDIRPGRVDLPGRRAHFQIGKEGWTTEETVIVPTAPIASVNVHVLFRHRYTGTVWFDDLYLGTLTDGPLVGETDDFPPVANEDLPDAFCTTLAALPPDQGLLYAKPKAVNGTPGALPSLWLNGRPLRRAAEAATTDALHRMPWVFPRHAILPPPQPSFAHVVVARLNGEPSVRIETRSTDAASLEYLMALPTGATIESVDLCGWETASNDLWIRKNRGRTLISVQTAVQADSSAVRFRLSAPSPTPEAGKERRAARGQHTVSTANGLALLLAGDGLIDGIRIGKQDLLTKRHPESPNSLPGGLFVRDLFGDGERPVDGTVVTENGRIRLSSVLEEEALELNALYQPCDDRIDVEIEVNDRLGQDRALDLTFRLPMDLSDCLWCEDITQTRPFEADKPLESSVYPWAVIAAPGQGAGIALAVPPHRPAAAVFVCDPRRGHVAIRFPLGISQAGRIPGRTTVSFSLFRTSGREAFRDATTQYYEAFPELFRRVAQHEGGWLFACPTAKLKNPEDYAYHEGGPAGLELDESLNILTCPYRIPTQRQIVFPALPTSDGEAAQWIHELSEATLPVGWKCRGAQLHRTDRGGHSLFLATDDPTASVSVTQDVEVEQKAIAEIRIGGRCRTEGVSGVRDSNFGIYADLFYVDGTRLYGQCVSFGTGTHDWQNAETVIRPPKPVRMIRLHVLMRRTHAGRAWFDDVFVREATGDTNHVRNPQFEDTQTHAYATMMQNCASHDTTGTPYIVRRDNVGVDIVPKNPIYNVVYAVNCDPDLFTDRAGTLTVGQYELKTIERLLARRPKLDGIYLDSTSGWVTRYPNFRREHFRYANHALSYDADSGRVIVPGWMHTYEFMRELRSRLNANGKIVFPNNGRGRRNAPLYFVCDVIGLEGGLRRGDFEEQLNFYRTLAGRRPILVMEYLEVLGKPTRHATRAGFERLWKWCTLYGVHPSIGRSCVEAYEQFPDVYHRFRGPLKQLGKAGWEPLTHAATTPGVRIERFGNAKGGVYFTVLNPATEARTVQVTVDMTALGLPAGAVLKDVFSDTALGTSPVTLNLASEDIAILSCRP
ncbi:MAG: hypothetical protein HON70_32130 [Lentisphaerae bacterium]|nr:hypothetical protein [Lentisphaerota bacterium]